MCMVTSAGVVILFVSKRRVLIIYRHFGNWLFGAVSFPAHRAVWDVSV